MWASLVMTLVPMLPTFISAIESLFSPKPKSGPQKLAAVQQLALQAVSLAGIIDPKQIGQNEQTLVQDITNAIVKYNNARGVFTHAAS